MKLISRILTLFVLIPIGVVVLLAGAGIGIGAMLIFGASVAFGFLLKFYKQKPGEWS